MYVQLTANTEEVMGNDDRDPEKISKHTVEKIVQAPVSGLGQGQKSSLISRCV